MGPRTGWGSARRGRGGLAASPFVMGCCVLACCVTGCDASLTLAVDLVSDLRAGDEVDEVEVGLAPPSSVPPHVSALEARLDLSRATRVAELEGVAPGDVDLRVVLRASGEAVARRSVSVRLREDTIVTVLVTRSCLERSCPGATDDPTSTECVGGRCQSPSCLPEQPDDCPPPACLADRDCPDVGCLVGRCTGGVCLSVRDDERCGAGERCVDGGRCAGDLPDAGPPDAGPPDAGPPDAAADACSPAAETCDGADEDCDGRVDEDFDLASDPTRCGACGVSCGEGELCSDGACQCGPTTGGVGTGAVCPGSGRCCSGICEVDDLDHCGGCAMPCNVGTADRCSAGECRCGAQPACTGGRTCSGGTCFI